MIMERFLRKEMINCTLCHDGVCTKACSRGEDPCGVLRSLWFANEAGAGLRVCGGCEDCDAPCENACPKEVPIRRVMNRAAAFRNEAQHLEPEDYARLKTDICGIEMENPFMLSSSVVGSTYDMCARAFDAGWAGVSFKTICMMDIHEASPRYSCIKGDTGAIIGFKNIEQLSDHSLVENLDIFKHLKENYPGKFLLASIMGRNEEEWGYLSRAVTEAGADAIELNFSCPNMVEEGTGSDVGQCPDLVELYTRAACRGTDIPVIAKLTPNVGTMSEAAEAAKRGGAKGIAAINTIKSLIEVAPRKGKVAVGGFSGPAVKPVALRFISELGHNPEMKGMHLSGMGGIETWQDAAEFMALGAGSVQVTTAVMQYGYRIVTDMIEGLAFYLKSYDLTVRDIIGSMLYQVVDVEEIKRDIVIYPKFLRNKCTGCGRCHISCMDGGHQAISLNKDREPVFDPERCVGCHLCVLVCPEGAIISSEKEVSRKK